MSTFIKNKQGLRVLVAGTVLQFFFGIIYVWSVFKAPVSVYYGWEPSGVGLTGSFMLCFFCLGIMMGGRAQMKIGVKLTTLIGGLMVSAGMLATALIPSSLSGESRAPIFLIYLCYGIIGGFGVGAGYNAIISTAQKWFPKNRGFATGISVAAFGFSTVVFAPMISALINKFEVNITFFILSAMFAVVVLVMFGFIENPDQTSDSSEITYKDKQYTSSEMVKSLRFYLISLSMMFGASVFFVIMPDLKDLAQNRGAEEYAMVLVMVMGVANALGRLCIPTLSDKIGREPACLIILSATALGAFGLCVVQGGLLIAMVVVIAFSYGGIAGLYPVLTSDNFGVKNVGSNYGMVMIGFMISAIVFPFAISKIDAHLLKFISLGLLAATGTTLVVILRLVNAKRKREAQIAEV